MLEATLLWVGKAVGMEVVWEGAVCFFEQSDYEVNKDKSCPCPLATWQETSG